MRTLVLLILAIVLSQFFRSTMAVLAPDMAADLGATAADLGRLSGMWFLAFSLAQIPIGVLLDRWGPLRSASLGLAVTAAGAVLFGAAPSLEIAYLGQALLGLGCAPLYMASVVVMARRYSLERFALANGYVIAVSNLGLVLSATPLAALDLWFGWRGAMGIMGAVTAMLALFLAFAARGEKMGAPESLSRAFAGILAIMRLRALWWLLPFSFVCSGVVLSVRGIWAGPYLYEVHGMAPIEYGDVLAAMVIALAAANLLFGWMSSRLGSPKPYIAGVAVLGVAATGALAGAPDMALAPAIACLIAIGFYGAAYGLVIAHGRAFFPEGMEGRGATLLNFFNFFGTAVLQVATGEVLAGARDAGAGTAGAYGWVFGLLSVALLATTMLYLKSADPRASAR